MANEDEQRLRNWTALEDAMEAMRQGIVGNSEHTKHKEPQNVQETSTKGVDEQTSDEGLDEEEPKPADMGESFNAQASDLFNKAAADFNHEDGNVQLIEHYQYRDGEIDEHGYF